MKLLATALALLLVLASAPGVGAAADGELPAGHFYTQANGSAGADYGYRVTDEAGIGLWSEFQRLGGVAALGYPISRRFMLDGYVSQATQKYILQWRPDASQVTFVNVFDKLHDLGQDGALQSTYQIPPPLDPNTFDAGKTPDQARADRLTLLNADPGIAQRYNFGGDPLLYNGLPTSAITNEGAFLTLRAQRTALQHWLVANPAAGVQRGDVTVVNAGDIAKALGLVPAGATQPETIAGQVLPAPAAAPVVAPAGLGGGPPAPPTAAAPAAPTLLYHSKDVTTPPMDCSPDPLGSALPCVSQIGSLGTQFIRGRVMTAKGDHLQWVTVQANIGGSISSVQSNGDGTFYFQLAQGCPNYAIQAQLVVLDNAGRVASDTKTITYTGNCYLNGEFHFDFIRAN